MLLTIHLKYSFLNSLTHQLQIKLYNLCAPEQPITKTYDELVALLTYYLNQVPVHYNTHLSHEHKVKMK